MVEYLHGPVKHDAFFKKYAHKKFMKGMFSPVCNIVDMLLTLAASMVIRNWVKANHQKYI